MRARRSLLLDRLPVWRLVGFFALLSIVPLGLLTYSALKLSGDAVREEVEARVRATASVSASVVESEMQGFANLVNSYAQRPSLVEAFANGKRSGFDGALIYNHLKQLQDSRGGIGGVFATDTRGVLTQVLPKTPSIVGDDFSFRDWYVGVTETGQPYISEAYETAIAGRPLVVAAAAYVRAPAEKGPGRPLGIVAAVYELDAIQAFAQRVAEVQGVNLTVTDQRGVLIASPDGAPSRLISRANNYQVARALGGRAGVTRAGTERGEAVSAFAPVEGIGWTVSADVPMAAAFASAGRLRSTVLAIAVLLGLLLVGGLFFLVTLLRHRQRAEQTLSESEQRTRAILEAAGDAFLSMDARGFITDWNDRAEDLFGWPREQAIGRRLSETIIPTELREAHERGVRDYLETGEGPILNQRIQMTARRRDDHHFPVELIIWPTESNGTVSFNSFINDITDRKRAETSRAHLAAIVESSEDAVYSKSLDGTILTWNEGAEKLYGYSSEVIGQPISLLLPPGYSDEVEDLLNRVMYGEPVRHHETERMRKDGSIVPVALTISPIKDDAGNVIAASTIARDISEIKRAEQALRDAYELELVKLQELDRTKTDLVSTVSHELRTPLTSIIGFLEMLVDGEGGSLSPEQRQMLAVVDRNSRRLLSLIEDLLTLSRIDSGSFRSSMEAIDIDSLIESVCHATDPALAAQSHEMIVNVSPDVGSVLGDPGQLERALFNLLSNAIKFTPPKGRIVVTACRRGDDIVISVADSGIGIPLEEQHNLFTRFFRSSVAQKQAIQGTGLGLSIVKTIVDHHGGSITVDSTPGVGTTVTLVLPRLVESANQEAMA